MFTGLVKAKRSADGLSVDANSPKYISQLSLVDMAGSERTKRTGNKILSKAFLMMFRYALAKCYVFQTYSDKKSSRNCRVI